MTASNHNHRILAFAAAVLSVFLCSCEYEFDLADVSSEPDRLNIICTMDELSYPTLSAKVAVPINKYDDGQSINKEIEYCDLYINGNKTTLEQYVTDGMGTNWRSSQKANPGDELSIKAKGRTTVLAEASVRVPDVLSISKIDTTSIYIDSHFEYRSEMRFSILFDHISKGDCIELRISMRRLSDIESGIPMESPLRIIRTDGTSFIYSMDRNSDAIVIESSELKDGNRLDIVTDYIKPMSGDESYSYFIKASKVSASYYRYSKSLYMQDNNVLADLGFSASNYSYSNIKGGFGVLAASSPVIVSEISIR